MQVKAFWPQRIPSGQGAIVELTVMETRPCENCGYFYTAWCGTPSIPGARTQGGSFRVPLAEASSAPAEQPLHC